MPTFGWIVLGVAGVAVVASGVLALIGIGPARRRDRLDRLTKRHLLENERESLNAELQRLAGEAGKNACSKIVADTYGDSVRSEVISGGLAVAEAHRSAIEKRLRQIEQEQELL